MTSTLIILSVFKGFPLSMILWLLAVIILLCVSAMVSASETAAFSLSPADFDRIKAEKSNKYKNVIKILETPKRLLATILIVNNFVNVAIIMISTYIMNRLFDFSATPTLGFIVEVVVITALILLSGEIIPKVYASNNALRSISFLSGIIKIFMTITYPVAILLVRGTSIVDRRLAKKSRNISIDELSDVIEITAGEETGIQESKILKGIVHFGDIAVSEIMRPRTDVTAVDITCNFSELMSIILDAGYSRMPVYKDNFDQVEGILYIKDLLPCLTEKPDFEWQKLLRPAFFVPENKKIDDLLSEFQERKIHLAIVVDEYGGTSGIVTLEDIMEEILGEISDEFDSESDGAFYHKINDTTYIFDAKISLVDFCKIFHIGNDYFDDMKGEAETLAGLILETTGKFPQKNDVIVINAFKFYIEATDKRRISRVRVERKQNN